MAEASSATEVISQKPCNLRSERPGFSAGYLTSPSAHSTEKGVKDKHLLHVSHSLPASKEIPVKILEKY